MLDAALAWLAAYTAADDPAAAPAAEPGRPSGGNGSLWIGVYSENHGAQRLYARQGFVKVGEYEFEVGAQRDREFIFWRGPGDASGGAPGGVNGECPPPPASPGIKGPKPEVREEAPLI